MISITDDVLLYFNDAAWTLPRCASAGLNRVLPIDTLGWSAFRLLCPVLLSSREVCLPSVQFDLRKRIRERRMVLIDVPTVGLSFRARLCWPSARCCATVTLLLCCMPRPYPLRIAFFRDMARCFHAHISAQKYYNHCCFASLLFVFAMIYDSWSV